MLHYLFFAPHHISILRIGICLYSLPTCLDVLYHSHAQHILLRQYIFQTFKDSTGISTCCPSATLFSLALGPDLPWGDEPCPGILRFSTGEILTRLFATYASILSSMMSTAPFGTASAFIQCSSTTCYYKSTTSVSDLAPEIFGAKSLDQ